MANLQNRDPDNLHSNPHDPNYVNPNGVVDPRRAVSYRDGYIHGRVSERHLQEEELVVRDNNNAARGLLIGIVLTALVAIGVGALFFWNQRQQEQIPAAPAVVPVVPASPAPATSQNQGKQTTVIERHTVEQVPVSVPQQAAPPNVNVNVPAQPAPRTNVNVTVPNASQQPTGEKSTTTINVSPAPTQSQSKSEKSRSQSSNSTTNTTPSSANGQNTTRSEYSNSPSNSGSGSTTNSNH
jgi:hypothetical protein